MKIAVLLAVAALLLAPAAFSQCQGDGCQEQTLFVARPTEGTVIVPIRLPQEPASIAEVTSNAVDLFAAGVVRNNGSRGITGVRIGWATVDKNGNFTADQGQLIDIAWPRPLPKAAHAYIANQAVPVVTDNIVKVVFFVAQVVFVGGSSYSADLGELKTVALADNQRPGLTTSQVPRPSLSTTVDAVSRFPIEVTATCVSLLTVSYMALDKTFSGTVPQWLFLQDFQPVTQRKKKQR